MPTNIWNLDITKTIKYQDRSSFQTCVRLLTEVAPVLAEYRGKWPIYAILKQYLGTHSRTRTKDLAMEAEEDNGPDRDAIRIYFE